MLSCIKCSQTVLAACLHSLQYVKLGMIVTVLSQIIPHQKSVSALLPQSCHAAVPPNLVTSLNAILIFHASLPSPSLHSKIALYCKMQHGIFQKKGEPPCSNLSSYPTANLETQGVKTLPSGIFLPYVF